MFTIVPGSLQYHPDLLHREDEAVGQVEQHGREYRIARQPSRCESETTSCSPMARSAACRALLTIKSESVCAIEPYS
jgi:hypothetical protein